MHRLLPMSDRERDTEILALRHQIMVLTPTRRRKHPVATPGAAGRASPGWTGGLVEGGDRRLAPQSPQGRPKTGPIPVDRARPGSKHHVITDAHGIPLAITLTSGYRRML
jgi:hypothetical protein